MAEPDLPPARYEKADVSVGALAAGFAAVMLTLLLSLFLAMWLYPNVVVDRRLQAALPRYPSPRLQEDPAMDLQRFVADETKRLNSAGWVDQAHGVAHIPIDEAMRMVAQRGIADWPGPKGAQP